MQLSGSKRSGGFKCSNRSAACIPAALLFLLGLSWQVSANSNHMMCTQHSPANSSTQPYVTTAKQQASIVVFVTTKDSSTDRRSWLRNQFKRNVALLRKQDPAAADGVVLVFAIGSRGLGSGRPCTACENQRAAL